MTIYAVAKWKCAVENGNLCSFVLRCLNEPFIYNGITIFCTQCIFEPILSIWSVKVAFYAKRFSFRGFILWPLTRGTLGYAPIFDDYSQNVQYLIFFKLCPGVIHTSIGVAIEAGPAGPTPPNFARAKNIKEV